MDDKSDEEPLYTVEHEDEGAESWHVVGPHGLVGVYGTAGEAQARADALNEQVAEAMEDDS